MKKVLLVISILLFVTLACNFIPPQTEPTIQAVSTLPQMQPEQGKTDLPLTEADVPRVSVEEAKIAFDSGEAVIVDVRSTEYYAAGHAAGAISIPLAGFEINIENLPLDKSQWIIPYCT